MLCALCTASCALIVNLSNRMALPLIPSAEEHQTIAGGDSRWRNGERRENRKSTTKTQSHKGRQIETWSGCQPVLLPVPLCVFVSLWLVSVGYPYAVSPLDWIWILRGLTASCFGR